MLGLLKFTQATYVFLFLSTNMLYFHVFPALQVFPYGLVKLLGGLVSASSSIHYSLH